jgi:hypothetical protein
VSSLAEGADQLVAREVLNAGGKLYVVIPCRQYRRAFESDSALLQFDELCSLASRVEILDFEEPSEEAYWGAGKSVVAEADQMLAIWDGRPSRGLGGTADVVEYAQRQNVHVDVIWPERTNR